MARIIRTRSSLPGGRSRWWSTVIAGAAVGALAAWVVLRGRRGDEDDVEPEDAPRPRGSRREPDLEAMTERLRRVPGAHSLKLRSLGGGILELVGSAEATLDVPALLHALASEPRVSVVVNRVWTPNSPGGEPTALPTSEPGDPSGSTPDVP